MSANEFSDALHARVVRSGVLDDVKVREEERKTEKKKNGEKRGKMLGSYVGRLITSPPSSSFFPLSSFHLFSFHFYLRLGCARR